MFVVVLLICAADLLPSNCNRATALDIMVGPTAANELICGKHGQAYAAESGRVVLNASYLKIVCSRQRPA